MTAVLSVPQSQLADALTQVRMSRHHQACRCASYRSPTVHAPFCGVDEYRYSTMVDRLLTTVLQQASF